MGGGASGICCVGGRVHVKSRQTNSLKNANCVVNAMWMWCKRRGTPLECICVWNVWNVNVCVWILLVVKLYWYVKVFPRPSFRGDFQIFSKIWNLICNLDSFKMSSLDGLSPRCLCLFLVWSCMFWMCIRFLWAFRLLTSRVVRSVQRVNILFQMIKSIGLGLNTLIQLVLRVEFECYKYTLTIA